MGARQGSGLTSSFWLGPEVLDMLPVSVECGVWEINCFEEKNDKLYCGHVEFELPMGFE